MKLLKITFKRQIWDDFYIFLMDPYLAKKDQVGLHKLMPKLRKDIKNEVAFKLYDQLHTQSKETI